MQCLSFCEKDSVIDKTNKRATSVYLSDDRAILPEKLSNDVYS